MAATMNEAADTHPQYSSRDWSSGGWFGGALGSCVWMVIVGCLFVAEGQILLAVVPLTCSFATMMAAVVIWKYRCRMTYMSGVLSFIAVVSITTLIVWLSVSLFANDRSLAKVNWPASLSKTGYALFVMPLMGLWSLWLQRGWHVPTSERHPTKEA